MLGRQDIGASLKGFTLAKAETVRVSKSTMMMKNYDPLNKILIEINK